MAMLLFIYIWYNITLLCNVVWKLIILITLIKKIHRNENVIWMKFSSRAATEAVILIISGGASDENDYSVFKCFGPISFILQSDKHDVNITIFPFKCNALSVLENGQQYTFSKTFHTAEWKYILPCTNYPQVKIQINLLRLQMHVCGNAENVCILET